MDFALILFVFLVITGVLVLYGRSRGYRGGEGEVAPWPIEYSRAFFPVILLVFLLRSFVVEPFRIPSGSMLPSLEIGDFILVSKFSYGLRLPIVNRKMIDLGQPKRGDVMVFRYPADPATNYIKRVIGLPGDRVEYRNKRLWINQQPVELTTNEAQDSSEFTVRLKENLFGVRHDIFLDQRFPEYGAHSWTVPEGHYFVMGDNRDHSNDSRRWQPGLQFVPDANLVGRAFFIWFNWDIFNGGGLNWQRIGKSIASANDQEVENAET